MSERTKQKENEDGRKGTNYWHQPQNQANNGQRSATDSGLHFEPGKEEAGNSPTGDGGRGAGLSARALSGQVPASRAGRRFERIFRLPDQMEKGQRRRGFGQGAGKPPQAGGQEMADR